MVVGLGGGGGGGGGWGGGGGGGGPPSLSCFLSPVRCQQSQIKATGLYRRSVLAMADLYRAIIVVISIAQYYKIYYNIYTKYLK